MVKQSRQDADFPSSSQLPTGAPQCANMASHGKQKTPPTWLIILTILGIGAITPAWLVRFAWQRNRDNASDSRQIETVAVAWTFEAQKRGAIISSPLIAGDRIYVAALHDTAFSNAGAVYCLDRQTGKCVWSFDDGGKMQHMYSSPCLADGRLYIGEGMHANFTCKMYCLDAALGKKLWHFVAAGHIESSPCVADGKVFFGAGDDGIYCLDAVSGKKLWQFQGPFHIDSSPTVSGQRLYLGSGISRRHSKMEALCLDTADGHVIWRLPTKLPVWGSPIVDGPDVFFGLGNGRLTVSATPPEQPAGALLCLDCQTGEARWRYDVSDAIFSRAAVDPRHVFFGARNGYCHCLDRQTGELCWKKDLGSPVLTVPALRDGRLYVIASGGMAYCLDSDTGQDKWTFDVARHSQSKPQLYSSPAVVADSGEDGSQRLICVGAELSNAGGSAAVLYCLRD